MWGFYHNRWRRPSTPAVIEELDDVIFQLRHPNFRRKSIMAAEAWATALAARLEAVVGTVQADQAAAATLAQTTADNQAALTKAVTDLEAAANGSPAAPAPAPAPGPAA